jgi:hypothetical protein
VCPAPATVEAKTGEAEMVKAEMVKAKIVETKLPKSRQREQLPNPRTLFERTQ